MKWPHDDTAAKMAFYGDFRKKVWASIELIHIKPPFLIRYEGTLLTKGILVHEKIAPATMAAFKDIWAQCEFSQDKLDHTGVSSYGGCFNVRRIAGSNNWSNHSWACAIDFDPEHNAFNSGHGTISPIVINAFKAQGALWGGDYKGRTDPMHFEFVSR